MRLSRSGDGVPWRNKNKDNGKDEERDRRSRRIAGGEVKWTCEDGECKA